MSNKLPIKRLIICAAIAVVTVGLGYYNIIYGIDGNYVEVFQGVIAAVGMTAIGEIFASLSKYPMISYIISGLICSAALQAMTPWNTILPRCDFDDVDKIFDAFYYSIKSCLVVYSIAFAVSILFGLFVLHRKDIFKSDE